MNEEDPRLEAYTLLLQFKDAPPSQEMRAAIAEKTGSTIAAINGFIYR